MNTQNVLFATVAASCLISTSAAVAQCTPAWIEQFQLECAGTNGPVRALTTFNGALIVGGQFSVAGADPGECGTPYPQGATTAIASWDGTAWSALGTGGMNNSVLALTTFNGQLIAGGLFTTADGVSANYVAKWDGVAWSPLGSGMNGAVYALATFDDDGAGPHPPALYAGGNFTKAGGTTVNYIAKWNGTSWTKLGSGSNAGVNKTVRALATFNDGSGERLYVGGEFTKAGTLSQTNRVASWNGGSWSKLGSGTTATVFALAPFNDGSGMKLYVGGMFATAGGVAGTTAIARWSGSTWSALGGGANNTVMSLAAFDDGSGSALYVGGYFSDVSGVPSTAHIARWNGAWSAVGAGMNYDGSGTAVFALRPFDADGAGTDAPALYAGGFFQVAPAGDGYFAKWQGCP